MGASCVAIVSCTSPLSNYCRQNKYTTSLRKETGANIDSRLFPHATKSQFYRYVASGGTIVIYPGTEFTDLIVISRVTILFCAAIVCAMDWPAGNGLSNG